MKYIDTYTDNLIKTVENKVNYLDKLKIENKKTKISYTSDTYGKHHFIPYLKIVVKKPKHLTYLKLMPRKLYNYEVKYRLNNFAVDHLNLDYQADLRNSTNLIKRLKIFLQLLHGINIKKITLAFKVKAFPFPIYEKYSKILKYYLQKYCNNVYITMDFTLSAYSFQMEFWKNFNISKYECIIMDKLKPNYHRNYKLENRITKKHN